MTSLGTTFDTSEELPPELLPDLEGPEAPLTDAELRSIVDTSATCDGVPWFPAEEEFEEFIDCDPHKEESNELVYLQPSEFASNAFYMPAKGKPGYEPFSFAGRRHLLSPYNTNTKRLLLKAGRQVEKCGSLTTCLTLANGNRVKAGEVRKGDQVVCLDMLRRDGTRFTTSPVVWVSAVVRKPCLRITTRQGHELEVATTHPVRVWDGWRAAGCIKVGERVAAIRKGGVFGQHQVDPLRVELTAAMLGDGGLTTPSYTFTKSPGPLLSRVQELLIAAGHTYGAAQKKDSTAFSLRVHHNGPLYAWMAEDGLHGKYSHEKHIPAWVFDLDRESTALFINRLWATDGHAATHGGRDKLEISYSSASKELVCQLQALLWKFGVPTSRRPYQPDYICTSGEPSRMSYILRVETQQGMRTFLSEIGALGKSEGVTCVEAEENNNRDTLPKEISRLIARIAAAVTPQDGRRSGPSLYAAGLRRTPKHPPTQAKLREYVAFFRQHPQYDQTLVDQLEWHTDSDVFWDEVETLETIGDQDCIDFEVHAHHNYLLDGVVTHNSTLLGNLAITFSAMIPAYRILYVSPSATQTKTFSVDRIKEPIETSPVLRAYASRAISMNVFEKQLRNRSMIRLRYAFLNADRARGIAAYKLMIDEIQDIISDNIAILEHCTSHAPPEHRSYIYSGTPKSLSNTLEYYWANLSTQGEWLVPCDNHTTHTGTGALNRARHWNILTERSIGKTGPICDICRKRIYPNHKDAQWAFQVARSEKTPWEAYRISQLQVPWTKWEDVLYALETSNTDKFYNEVLGISYDTGLRPLTKANILACCSDEPMDLPLEVLLKKYEGKNIYAGLDYGTGEHSYTVLVLGCYVDSKFRIFYMRRFVGEFMQPAPQIREIIRILAKAKVRRIGEDYGGGHHPHDALVRVFGRPRAIRYQYVSKARKKCELKPALARFIVYRTEVMSDVFNAIKRQQIEFPRWRDIEKPYAMDMLNIHSEYNERRREVDYTHRPDKPDDTLHAILYCFLVSMIDYPRPDILAPTQQNPFTGASISAYSGPIAQV